MTSRILTLYTCKVAGSYESTEISSIPLPSATSHPAYRQQAIRHVGRTHSGPTEFISLSRNLIRCLHRALKSESTSSIAVMYVSSASSLTKLITSSDLHVLQRLGRVQSASSLKLQVEHHYVRKCL